MGGFLEQLGRENGLAACRACVHREIMLLLPAAYWAGTEQQAAGRNMSKSSIAAWLTW